MKRLCFNGLPPQKHFNSKTYCTLPVASAALSCMHGTVHNTVPGPQQNSSVLCDGWPKIYPEFHIKNLLLSVILSGSFQ